MKNLGKLAFLGAVITATSVFASASTVTGYFWNSAVSGITACSPPVDGTCGGSQGAIPASLPSTGTATTTFSFNLPGNTIYDMFSADDNSLNSFLTTNHLGASNGVSPVTYGTPSQSGDNINYGLFEFFGTTVVTNGELLTTKHDDGLDLWINGVEVITAGGPTSAEESDIGATCGSSSCVVPYEIVYAETNGAPAVLQANLGSTTVPEPSSLMLLGTGLVGAAGMLFRRRQQTV